MVLTRQHLLVCVSRLTDPFLPHRLSDASGDLQMTEEGQGSIGRDKLDENDVFILDTGKALYVWVGNGTSSAEQRNAIPYAHVSTHLYML